MLSFVSELAYDTGQLLKQKREEHREIDRKSTSSDLVTDADQASEAFVVDRIRKAYPNHAILGEEGTGDRGLLQQDGFVWVIDPLDGTVNYAHQLPMFAVSICLLHDQQPLIGAIYLPILDELFVAEKGNGATCNGTPIRVSSTKTLEDSVVATGFAYDKHISDRDNLDNVARFIKRLRGIRRMGAAAVDLAYTACGKLDGYWEDKIQPWDIAAGMLLVEEAGGRVSNYKNQHLTPSSPHLIVSNGLIHDEMASLLQPYVDKHKL
jgi:myo-inositol-1(or 4)-monophosphatase